jgi:hypothetical protein
LQANTREYLLKASIEMLRAEDIVMKVRYDRIKVGGKSDRWYDPFQLIPVRKRVVSKRLEENKEGSEWDAESVANSYLEDFVVPYPSMRVSKQTK